MGSAMVDFPAVVVVYTSLMGSGGFFRVGSTQLDVTLWSAPPMTGPLTLPNDDGDPLIA